MPKDANKQTKSSKDKRHFFKDFKAELKKVIWPTPKQLVNDTIAVITIVLITAVIVFVLDLTFESINTYGINKLKSAIESSQNETTTNSTSEEQNAIGNNENSVNENQTAEGQEAGNVTEENGQE